MNRLWLAGILHRGAGWLFGTAAGVALTVALLAMLSMFLVDSSVSMTRRAVSVVPIDWQVEAVPGADLAMVQDAVDESAKVSSIEPVYYAAVDGLEANAGGTVQTTGPGRIIAFGPDYPNVFPDEVRLLSGRLDGILVAQQTAANLHVAPGDTVSIKRMSLPPQTVRIDGVVDLPDADALFQSVGLPAQISPQAPPDNVLILPVEEWQRLFGPQQSARPDTTRAQLHVRLDHEVLPWRPTDAWITVTSAAKNLEVRLVGQALVSDNLAARLDAVRGDSLYASVLFLFLGVPGIALASVLTFAVTAISAHRRRAEVALLRLRGANALRILGLASAEASLVAALGIVVGLGAALLIGNFQFSASVASGAIPLLLAGVMGWLLALAAFLYPTWRDMRGHTVSVARRSIDSRSAPLWARLWLDVLLVASSLLLLWKSSSSGYQVVLAPEGVAATAVDYSAFAAPLMFWIGFALVAVRISDWILAGNGEGLRFLLRPVAGRLTPIVSAALSHQSGRISIGIAMTALAVSFAVSTAIFNMTFNAQALVDAQLTNGADVTVFGTAAIPASAEMDVLSSLPDVIAVQPMQHRFAYVGSDLQDLYGIDPTAIGKVTNLSDTYFSGGSASTLLTQLADRGDGVLVSEETVQDFQLAIGDIINLRLMNVVDHQYHPVPFTFIGVAREFPTAPSDSFLVANAAYIAKVTGSAASEYLLMKAAGDPAVLFAEAKNMLRRVPALQIKDVGSAAKIISSTLTAVDLSGLTTIELGFALAMAVASAGLMLALGVIERRRDFAILAAIGARPDQIATFLWAEGLLVAIGGVSFGAIQGAALAWMLVKLLTGVFDPAPESLSAPLAYLSVALALLLASIVVAVFAVQPRRGSNISQYLRQ